MKRSKSNQTLKISEFIEEAIDSLILLSGISELLVELIFPAEVILLCLGYQWCNLKYVEKVNMIL